MSTSARIDELRSKFDENPRRYFAPLANEYRKAGDLAQAIALCREHLPKQPGHMSGHIVFGQALFEHGELAEAQAVFESALELDPENLIALRHLGDIARSRGDSLSAKRWYERVLDADPRNDDIASLLASLSQRMTPSVSQSPFGSPNAPTDYAPPIAPEPVEEDAFDAADSPAWHTPAFLTPLGSPIVPPTPSASFAPLEPPELLDLDSMVESAASSSVSEGATSYDDASGVDAAAESAFSFDEALLDGVPDEADVVESVTDEADPLAVALDAFATNELFDAATDESEDAEASNIDSFSSIESPDALIEVHSFAPSVPETASPAQEFDDADVFEEGLVAQEWPDTAVLSSRAFTPARARTPIDSAVVDEAFGQEVVEEESVAAIESAAEPEAVPALEFESVAEVVSALEPGAAVESVSALEPNAEAEEMAGVYFSAEPEPAVPLLFEEEAADETFIEAEGENPASAEVATEVAAELPAESIDELDDVSVVERITTAEFEAIAMVDEDPPVWSAEAPWSAVAEDEHEVDAFTGEFSEEPVADSADEFSDSARDAAPEESPSNPAFVTETMAELLVAQGFVDRAVSVYEELVSRRPYDEVLTSRLAELRATLEAEQLAEQAAVESAVQPTPLYGVTPVESLPPLRSATPAWSATPARSSVPLVAPMSRPTARQFFAALASVRVARRTPAYGAVSVSAPTPADGLASLFGEMPVISDDMAARSLAQAFGNQDAMQPGPSLFSPASEEERERRTMSAAPSVEESASASSFSFDRFFPDPATNASQPSSREGAETGGSVIGSDAGDPTSVPQPSAGEDLAQFASWLKGLSNS